MNKFKIIPQIIKKPKSLGIGYIDIHKKELFVFDEKDVIIYNIKEPEIIWMNTHGIMFKGYRFKGTDKTSKALYNYDELYCVFEE